MIGVGIAGHHGGVTVTTNLNFASGFLAVTDVVRIDRDAAITGFEADLHHADRSLHTRVRTKRAMLFACEYRKSTSYFRTCWILHVHR